MYFKKYNLIKDYEIGTVVTVTLLDGRIAKGVNGSNQFRQILKLECGQIIMLDLNKFKVVFK